MKKLLSLLFAIMFVASMANSQDQPDLRSWLDASSNWTIQGDTGVSCSGGVARDDGTYENGYRSVSTGDSTTMLHRMTLPAGATSITAICVTWTALSPSGNLGPYQLVIYDNSGSGGAPGNVPVAVVTGVVANGVAIYPGHSRYRYDVNITGLTAGNMYYVGVRWNNNPILPFFSSMDESGTANGFGYQRNTTTFPPTWGPLTTSFPNWKNCSFRFEYASGPPPVGTLTLCRNNVNLILPDNATVKDSMNVNLPPLSRILDVSVKIDTFTHTWDSDVRMYLSKSGIGTRMVNWVGGSGDNFIGTTIKDTVPLCQIGQPACNTAPFTGSFRPSVGGSLTGWANTTPNGYWVLTLTDSAGGDTGNLKAWCMIIRYDNLLGVSGNSNQTPTEYSLSQNYPNPFNPSTTIDFTLPKSEDVKLKVYDALGREVYTLISSRYERGNHKVQFDMAGFSSGIYFYKLEAGDFSATRKMMLIK